MALLRTKRNIF